MLTEGDIAALHAILADRLADLRAVADSSRDSRAPVELDQTSVGRLSRMDAIQQQAMALATERRRTLERRKIEAALRRIETQDYGLCVRCDEEIAIERLRIDPAITLCTDCMKALRSD